MKKMYWAIAFLAVLYAGAAVYIALTFHFGPDVLAETPLKQFIENSGYNLVGDAIAGFFAPITFMVVMTTLFLQQRQMDATLKEMDNQNKISLAVAKANYKFQLFDKRLAVYDELNEISMMVATTGTLDSQAFIRLNRASHAARHIFSDDDSIIDWVDQLGVIGRHIRIADERILYLENMQANKTFGENDQVKLLENRDWLAKSNQQLIELYNWDVMDEMFLPYLELPSDIVITGP